MNHIQLAGNMMDKKIFPDAEGLRRSGNIVQIIVRYGRCNDIEVLIIYRIMYQPYI